MNVYIATYSAHWLGGRAVIVAPDEATALKLLKAEAKTNGTDTKKIKPSDLKLLDTTVPAAHITFSGDY